MAVAINNSCLALDFIPQMQKELDHIVGGGRRFQIHRVCVYATIGPFDSELWHHPETPPHFNLCLERLMAKQEALDWQADPDDDLGELEVLHHLRQQAATVPILSSIDFTGDQSHATTILGGSALSPSIKTTTQGRILSSFHRYSFRLSYFQLWHPKRNSRRQKVKGVFRWNNMVAFPPQVRVQPPACFTPSFHCLRSHDPVVWASSQMAGHCTFWQVQVDVVDLFSRKTLPTSRPGKRRRTAFNPFLQVSDSTIADDTSRENPQVTHARRFNGVRYRPHRKIWVAEMKPPKHKNKQFFGNFKSEIEAARAVDVAFHLYGRRDLLNFPDTSLQFLSKRPTAAPGLDEKAKVKFVKEEAKKLLAAIPTTSPHHSPPTNSLQILELSASSRDACPSDHSLSLSEISSPFSCSGTDEVDTADSQPHQWLDPDSTCDISTVGMQSNLETLNSMQISEQGWDRAEDSCTLAAPPNVVDLNNYKNQSTWLDPLIRSPPAPMYSRSPSPSLFQEGIAYALLEQQSI